MTLKCLDFNGVPLVSHAGSTTYFPARVVRQLGGLQTVPKENDDFTDSPPVESSTSSGAPVPDMAIQVELANLRAERDRLRQEVAEKNEQLGDQHQLQKELAQAHAQLQRRDQELAQANATLERSRKRARGGEYTTDASSFSTAHGERATTTYHCRHATSTSWDSLGHLPQPISTSMSLPSGYAPLPPMYVPSSTTQAPPLAHDPTRMATLEGNVTTLQNTVDLIAANMAEMMALLRGANRASSSSIPPLARGPTVDLAPWVPPTHASEGDIATAPAPAIIPVPAPHTKHAPERRMKKMEETIRALQASDPRHSTSYLDSSLFPGMLLLLKVKMPKFEKYDGTKDPRHHLRHYHTKMLQYWDYEQFVVATFQESLSGSALNWFMSLQAEDIPSWVELAKKFVE
ncbi:hypothetical protein CRG98_033801 [Punica granatum]|uniref:Retrotransposon gag domain-containing protein n=1 Tax=Punica granatum TaxID=22663 RepID=A0A2I0IP61_PUNGR|nr:hypothetical protein CRG98_033801 [Punica granatum]